MLAGRPRYLAAPHLETREVSGYLAVVVALAVLTNNTLRALSIDDPAINVPATRHDAGKRFGVTGFIAKRVHRGHVVALSRRAVYQTTAQS